MAKLIKRSPYWVWIVGVSVALAIILTLVHWLDSPTIFHNVLYVFYGFIIGVLAASIARKVYK